MTELDTLPRSDSGCGEALSGLDRAAVDRFCCQYLQLEMHLDYPDGQLLRRPDIQGEIFDRIFLGQSHSVRNSRLQLRVLKELVARIQASISDDEYDDYVCMLTASDWRYLRIP